MSTVAPMVSFERIPSKYSCAGTSVTMDRRPSTPNGYNQRYRRRTVFVTRQSVHESFGFTLNSCQFMSHGVSMPDEHIYVEHVEEGSAADEAGMKRGDVLDALNGVPLFGVSLYSLVQLFSKQTSLSLVVVDQDIDRIFALQERYRRLQLELTAKVKLLCDLEEEENSIVSGGSADGCSLSTCSTVSTASHQNVFVSTVCLEDADADSQGFWNHVEHDHVTPPLVFVSEDVAVGKKPVRSNKALSHVIRLHDPEDVALEPVADAEPAERGSKVVPETLETDEGLDVMTSEPDGDQDSLDIDDRSSEDVSPISVMVTRL